MSGKGFPSVLLAMVGWLSGASDSFGQSVVVSLKLDTNQLAVGSTAILHVFAQVAPAQRANAERIFSWYVDLLDADGSVAQPDYNQLQKPVADKDPLTSSSGTADGWNRRGIYDTFLNLPGAGVSHAVELFSVPVHAVAAGRTLFAVQAGSGVSGLTADFIVAPKGGGTPLLGGDYSGASAELVVGGGGLLLSIAPSDTPGRFTIAFPVQPGTNYVVQYRNALGQGSGWQPLPGVPHNSGSVTVTNDAPQRFYRVSATN